MNPQEINEAIGDALGCSCGKTPHRVYCNRSRDYVGDLNSMNYAEQRFGSHEQGRYAVILSSVAPKTSIMGVSAFDVMHASAALRAKAWLMTVGLWVEQKRLTYHDIKAYFEAEKAVKQIEA